MSTLFELPDDLPIPLDDGACAHLVPKSIPSIPLASTDGKNVDLSELSGITVVYCYPRTATTDQPEHDGWNEIPGACGCTPQSCGFRDSWSSLQEIGVKHLFGLSTQGTDYQVEMVHRLNLPFPVLSDADFALIDALKLPTFEFKDFGRLVKRLTLIIEDGTIVKVFYPVFPPDKNSMQVLRWLRE